LVSGKVRSNNCSSIIEMVKSVGRTPGEQLRPDPEFLAGRYELFSGAS